MLRLLLLNYKGRILIFYLQISLVYRQVNRVNTHTLLRAKVVILRHRLLVFTFFHHWLIRPRCCILKVLLLQSRVQILRLEHPAWIALRTLIFLQMQLQSEIVLLIANHLILVDHSLSFGLLVDVCIADRLYSLRVIFKVSSSYCRQIWLPRHIVSTCVSCTITSHSSYTRTLQILLSDDKFLLFVKTDWFILAVRVHLILSLLICSSVSSLTFDILADWLLISSSF